MKTIYNWERAPIWAKFCATDSSGRQWWHERKPEISDAGRHWKNVGGGCEQAANVAQDWAESLEARPEPEAKPEPVKYDPEKLKPFDLDRALAGDPVCTEHGEPVAQLTRFQVTDGIYELAGIVGGRLATFTAQGKYDGYAPDSYFLDLRMARKTRTVYVNLYPNGTAYHYESEELAKRGARGNAIAIAAPVEIEE